MKFGKEFASQMVPEWREAYMNYHQLKIILKNTLHFRRQRPPNPNSNSKSPSQRGGGERELKRRVSLYRSFSGLTNTISGSPTQEESEEDEVIIVSEVGDGYYQTMFLLPSDESAEVEILFFRKLDEEFNKVLKFYREGVDEAMKEAEKLNIQMDALIGLQIMVRNPGIERPIYDTHFTNSTTSTPTSPISPSILVKKPGKRPMDAIEEDEMSSEGDGGNEISAPKSNNHKITNKEEKACGASGPSPLTILNQVKINIRTDTPVSILKNVLMSSKSELSFTKSDLRKAEEQMRIAFVEFHKQLRLLKGYCFLNILAFSKIMKKYDKINSRNASKAYLEMVDKSYIGTSDKVIKLIERVEAAFIKHFCNGNRREGMKMLRPTAKREKHRITFCMGLFFGCSLALAVAIIVIVHLRNIIKSPGHHKYMETLFPLYSLFVFIVLHMLMYAGNIFFWRRYRINYAFIFGFKQGTELGYREVLLVGSGLLLLALAGVLGNLDMKMDPSTKSFKTYTELLPLGLLVFVLLITICPFNIVYRSSRYFLIGCAFHCICAPLYKVVLADFFLADQLTSEVQAFRSVNFYVCYYGWGDFRKRESTCRESKIYEIFFIIIAVVPYWSRFLQCIRRLFEEKDWAHLTNGLKYFSTIVAVVMKAGHDLQWGRAWQIMAAVSLGVTTIFNTYWDIVIDWGLLRRNSINPLLRDKLLVPNKSVYFAAIVANVILRLAWMQSVLGFREGKFLHRQAVIVAVACLEIIRRGIWNFFRLENEHLNNVGKYRAFKSVPLPFSYDEDGHHRRKRD